MENFKLQWNFSRTSNIFIEKNAFESAGKWRPFCFGLNVLNHAVAEWYISVQFLSTQNDI